MEARLGIDKGLTRDYSLVSHKGKGANMKTTMLIASVLLAFATAACDDANARWAKENQASYAKWWENHDREKADRRAREAIEDNTDQLRRLNLRLTR